jgi:hypothetical protein
MNRFLFPSPSPARFVLGSVCALGLLLSSSQAAEVSPEEILSTLRTNLAGMSPVDLDKAAVEAILEKLYPRVFLTPPAKSNEPCTNCLEHSSLFDGSYGYVRFRAIQTGLRPELEETIRKLEGTNSLKGLVLDLRFSGGTDYAAAVEIANLFVSEVKPLLDWGQGVVSSQAQTNRFSAPLAILVNHETWGASEALAGTLRWAECGLLLGGSTSGKAAVFKSFTLSTTQQIEIAVTEVKMGDGKPIPSTGLQPDIQVGVSLEEERLFLTDPYRIHPRMAGSGGSGGRTNSGAGLRLSRLNEAELVRMRRENQGEDLERLIPNAVPQAKTEELRVVSDPALARALDLLKGLAVVRQSRSS